MPRKGAFLFSPLLQLDQQCVYLCQDRRFVLTGDGSLVDNLGTSTGSRPVQLYNGRAQISVWFNGGHSVLSVASTGLPTRVLHVQGSSLL